MKILLKPKYALFLIIALFTSFFLFGIYQHIQSQTNPIVSSRKIEFEEVARYLDNPEEVKVDAEGNYSLTKTQSEELLQNYTQANSEKLEEINLKALNKHFKKENGKNTTKQIAIDPEIGGKFVIENLELIAPKGFYSEPVIFNIHDTDKSNITAQTFTGDVITELTKSIELKTNNQTKQVQKFVLAEDFSNCGYLIDNTSGQLPCFLKSGMWLSQSSGYNGESVYLKYNPLDFAPKMVRWVPTKDELVERSPIDVYVSIPDLKADDYEATTNAVYWVFTSEGVQKKCLIKVNFLDKVLS